MAQILIPFPILGADDHEILPTAPPDTQGNMVFHHFLDRLPQ